MSKENKSAPTQFLTKLAEEIKTRSEPFLNELLHFDINEDIFNDMLSRSQSFLQSFLWQ